MADILRRMYDAKALQSAAEETRESYDAVRTRALERMRERRPFLAAIRSADGPAIIGEIKRASPSVGLIARNIDPAAVAASYDRAGADCISVLTETDHFLGDLTYLDLARRASSRPLLRKDFLSTRYQIAQSAAYGADAVLLIVAGLRDEQLLECIDEAKIYALDVLVEVHDAAELERARRFDIALIGINNRNLRTFETDLAVSEMLLPKVPPHMTAISESGMRGAADIARLHAAGARGFLIGEALMRSENAGALVADLKSALTSAAGA